MQNRTASYKTNSVGRLALLLGEANITSHNAHGTTVFPSLEGHVAVVTGAADGIGRHLAKRFLQTGTRVAAVDRDTRALETLASESNPDTMLTIASDVRNEREAEQAIDAVFDRWGRLDILVSNAGVVHHARIIDYDPALWREVVDINLNAAFLWARAAARRMIPQGHGRIINVSSHAALLGTVGRGAYSASKAGLLALTRTLAVELAEHGITANAIAPGPVQTPRVARNHGPERREAWAKAVPMHRYGSMDEIAAAILFLASPESSYITGQTLGIDGGFTIAGLAAEA